MIVMMDSNAHSTLFGSLEQNERGTIIENLLSEFGYVPFNEGNEPTFVRGNSKTLIDITYGSPELAGCI